MSCHGVLLAIIFPSRAVIDKGYVFFMVLLLTVIGMVHVVIASLIIMNKD